MKNTKVVQVCAAQKHLNNLLSRTVPVTLFCRQSVLDDGQICAACAAQMMSLSHVNKGKPGLWSGGMLL